MAIIELTTEKKNLAKILIECAESRKSITFKEVEELTGINKYRVSVAAMIISYKCKELGLPLISVLIVYSDKNKLEEGFAKEFFEDDFKKGLNSKIIEENTKKVFECNEWDRLRECL